MSSEPVKLVPAPPAGNEADGLVEQFHRMSAQLAESYAVLRKSEGRR